MIDICVGEYVRTTQGYIAKVERIDDTFIWFDGTIWFDGYEVCSELSIKNELGLYDQSNEIIKHSFNIIDLIEVGDYVNGNKILIIFEISKVREGKELFCMGEGGFEGEISYFNEDIQTIVTHEQFKSMEYKVGGEDD